MFDNHFSKGKLAKKEVVILIDAGSGSVGAGIALVAPEQKPEIIYFYREHYPIKERLKPSAISSTMIEALEKAVSSVSRFGLPALIKRGENRRISRAFCTLSSPWHVSSTKMLHFKFEHPFKVSRDFLRDVVKHEEKNFLAGISKEKKEEFGENLTRSEIAEMEILNSLIDGYPVFNPIGKIAGEFEITLFLSATPKSVKKSIERAVGKYFPNAETEINSTARVYWYVLKSIFPDEDNFMVAHVSGETTDISIVKKDIIIETISFPLGRNLIIRRLIKEVVGMNPATALSALRSEGDVQTALRPPEKARRALSQAREDWVALFSESVSDFSKEFFLPPKVFVLSGDNSAGIFADLITNKKLPVRGNGTPFISAFPIESNLFEKAILSGESENRDPFIEAEAVFVSLTATHSV